MVLLPSNLESIRFFHLEFELKNKIIPLSSSFRFEIKKCKALANWITSLFIRKYCRAYINEAWEPFES